MRGARRSVGARAVLWPLAVLTVVLLGLTTACGADPEGDQSQPHPPAPIEREEEAEDGPYEVRTHRLSAADVKGTFGGGTLHYPAERGEYPVVAAAPGLGADEEMVAWYGELLASYGVITLTMNTTTVNDSPDQRGGQILHALDHIVEDSVAADRADGERQGVLGHSMGGGGALVAAAERKDIRAVVALTPYYEGEVEDWSQVSAATLVIGGEADEIAPVEDHAEPLYEGLSGAREKTYLSLNGDHFVANSPTGVVTRQVVGWLQRFLSARVTGGPDKDHRDALCPVPAERPEIVDSRDTCPHR